MYTYDRRVAAAPPVLKKPEVVSRELLDDYDDRILQALGKFLGKRVSWGEGAWGRGPQGTLRRTLGLR